MRLTAGVIMLGLALAGGVCVSASNANAQGRPVPRAPTTVARDTSRVRFDSTGRDTTARDTTRTKELIKWNEADSVMKALMSREGYTATHYQGDVVRFNAETRTLNLEGNRAGVEREQTVLVADSISYNDSTKRILARGDTIVLRDPSQNSADVVSLGEMRYNVESRRGVVSNISTSISETGEKWFVGGAQAAFVSDTTRGHETAFYVRNGSITSCDDSIPDYHFESKEIKMVSKNIMVARPAVLYIGEVPVMWLPFIFQDMRSGRRSGVLPPRFGVSELFRNSPTYRRHLENLGYYFALNDYMDADFALDWRSGSRGTAEDPGYVRFNSDFQYRWLDRFVTGRVGLSHHAQRDGSTNTSVSWAHQQQFSQSTSFNANINYVTNTFIQRTTTFVPQQVLANISSSANYQTKIGPASLSLGGTRTQHPGRTEVTQSFPNFGIQVPTLSLTKWLDWTPLFDFHTDQTLNADQGLEFRYRYFVNSAGKQDSVQLKQNTRARSARFDTPLKIGNFTWSNTFQLTDDEQNSPATIVVVDPNDSSIKSNRIFARTFRSTLDWNTGITLPSFLQNSFKVTPSVTIQNVDPSAFWVRSQQNGGQWVHQRKRLVTSLGASPTLFALFPGFGPVSRFRHSITPLLSYSYAPAADINTEFLRALNRSRQGYLGSLAENRVQLSLSHVLEAKLKSTDTSSNAEAKKVKVFSMTFSPPLAYDFERARKTHRSGFVTDNIRSDFSSDLLPGFSASTAYSLYQGDILSDSARFKPFRTDLNLGFALNSQSGIFGAINRVFGRAVPPKSSQIERNEQSPDDALTNRIIAEPVAGVSSRNRQYSVPQTQGWNATIQYSWSRQRPPTGNGIVVNGNDPAVTCAYVQANPIVYNQCVQDELARASAGGGIPRTTAGAPFIRVPDRNNVQSQMNFHLTQKWSGSWGTNYDFEAKKFGAHQVTLQRELHDWRAIFAFTQAPNGNFAFNFFIALNAEPDLKFNYDRQTYRPLTP
ncbi:MAG TPA: putative LPS assembly protein LptD [Gemmatimonadaceae bacterium]